MTFLLNKLLSFLLIMFTIQFVLLAILSILRLIYSVFVSKKRIIINSINVMIFLFIVYLYIGIPENTIYQHPIQFILLSIIINIILRTFSKFEQELTYKRKK